MCKTQAFTIQAASGMFLCWYLPSQALKRKYIQFLNGSHYLYTQYHLSRNGQFTLNKLVVRAQAFVFQGLCEVAPVGCHATRTFSAFSA